VPLKRFKPTSASRRALTVEDFSDLTKKRPEKRLTEFLHNAAGRNNNGRITMHCRGGGHKRLYRKIDFRRDKDGIPGVVTALEYDPNRSSRIALITYADGDKRYILAPKQLAVGATVLSGPTAQFEVGHCMALDNIPLGMMVHCVELNPGRGGQLGRSAGNGCQVLGKEGEYVALRLPSGEMRRVPKECRATIGEVGNEDHLNVSIGKAGRSRWKGVRPSVRGVAMNPVDHPHGGGEGRTSGGRHPVTPWGVKTKGYKTRKRSHRSDKFIIRRRRNTRVD